MPGSFPVTFVGAPVFEAGRPPADRAAHGIGITVQRGNIVIGVLGASGPSLFAELDADAFEDFAKSMRAALDQSGIRARPRAVADDGGRP